MTNFYHSKNNMKRQRNWRVFGRTFKISGKILIWGAPLALLILVGAFVWIARDLPDPEKINERQITQSTKIFDRTGKVLLYDIHGEEKRTVVAFDQISDYVKKATVAGEDASFYSHFGLDFRGIARAVWGVITGNESAGGGSTITQQFIKKTYFSDKRSYSRKIKEWVLALELERKYSKDEILGFYLNQIPYGSNAYGIEAAAQTFFNKSAKDLGLAESAVLAALPNAPSRLSPYGSHPEELKARQEYILDRMVSIGYATKEEAEAAKKEPLEFAHQNANFKAPHFVMYVKEYLEEKYGEDYIEKAGLKVYTTLDWDLQFEAEKIIREGAENNAKKYQAYNAALAAVDPKTGQILAMVGSRDYNAQESLPAGCKPGDTCKFEPHVNVTIRDRQPGSSFKPFAYVTAFEKGYTPDTILFDLPTEFNPNCSASANQDKDQYGIDCYHPGNYDSKFRGPVTVRSSLAQSLNIPAVQALYLAGIDDTIKTAKTMGITSLNQSYYGLSLVLGGGEVKLLDQTAAYGVFAAEGKKYEKTPILKIEDSNGKIIEEFEAQSTQVLKPQLTRLVSDILSDNAARTPVFGANSALYFAERPVAAKTGTTQGYRDAWTMGYTPSLAVGVWVGNNNNSPMAASGAGIAAAGPLWHDFIKKAYELKTNDCNTDNQNFCLPKSPEQFNKPEPIVTEKSMLNGSYISTRTVKVDMLSGALATNDTPPQFIEERQIRQAHNILYYVNKDDPQGDYPANPQSDPQYKNWEAPVQAWLGQRGENYDETPTDSDPIRAEQNKPMVQILSPVNGQFISGSTVNVQVQASAPLGLKQIDYFLNDEFVGSNISSPYQITLAIPSSAFNSESSFITLRARAYDTAFNRSEDEVTLYLNRGSY